MINDNQSMLDTFADRLKWAETELQSVLEALAQRTLSDPWTDHITDQIVTVMSMLLLWSANRHLLENKPCN